MPVWKEPLLEEGLPATVDRPARQPPEHRASALHTNACVDREEPALQPGGEKNLLHTCPVTGER